MQIITEYSGGLNFRLVVEAEFDIYTTVTKELKQTEFDDFQKKLKEKKQEWKNRQEEDA